MKEFKSSDLRLKTGNEEANEYVDIHISIANIEQAKEDQIKDEAKKFLMEVKKITGWN